ncbi:MAG TPA: PIN domain-containing protein [Longimicrobium sp.]|nr:PIN domain-containing protein [Longimicrobium sp.]
MGILIDTSVLVHYERQSTDPTTALASATGTFVSVVTASELLHGAWRDPDPRRRHRRFAITEAVLDWAKVVEIDLSVARLHAEITAELASRGLRIGINDSWIAATCVEHRLALMTANVREFGRVPGLVLQPMPPES